MAYLYVIQAGEFVKIGISRNVQARLAELQTGNPLPLAILDAFEFADAEQVERALHQRFANARVQGEWFRLTAEDLEALADICRSYRLGNLPTVARSAAHLPTVHRVDLESLPTETVLAESNLQIVPTLRVERRGDRNPVGFAFYKRGYPPVYVCYLSGSVVSQW